MLKSKSIEHPLVLIRLSLLLSVAKLIEIPRILIERFGECV